MTNVYLVTAGYLYTTEEIGRKEEEKQVDYWRTAAARVPESGISFLIRT